MSIISKPSYDSVLDMTLFCCLVSSGVGVEYMPVTTPLRLRRALYAELLHVLLVSITSNVECSCSFFSTVKLISYNKCMAQSLICRSISLHSVVGNIMYLHSGI